ncbi:hypothetical protein B0681_03960 [Moraxella porci DSM 25326]|uniref:AAA+ ATPase domain-containing protein n=1 Tax=Moraxella porci DSM 25326 TaxID=573983 RepID=A0A1T0CU36_9GAMM|nr:AAA family ATPase [Moraxella porci]OOS25842.1 hypothetical protein B0681_03960 [Moraxella porci DSM 25326]
MKVKQLQLQNYGRFDNLTIQFAPNGETKGNVTIIVGNNGAGKSQILQALLDNLSNVIGYILNGRKEQKKEEDWVFFKNITGHTVPELSIRNNSNYTQIDTEILFSNKNSFVSVYSERKGANINNGSNVKISNNLFENLQYFLNKLTSNTIDKTNFPILAFYGTTRNIEKVKIDEHSDKDSHQILLGYLAYGLAESEYKRFFRWFRENEDLENENKKNLSNKILELIDGNNTNQIDHIKDAITEFKGNKKLQCVRQAIELFTDFKNIHIERQDTPKMFVEKDGEKLDVNQLSQGEKSLLALVGDIARRLAILNPSLDNPLHGEGVVLIDEIDLHLHPKWQQNLIDKLTKTFPNVQFILTTHSPHIVSDNPDVLVYILDNGELRAYNNAYGEDVNTLLSGVFGVSERTPEIAEKFKLIGDYISDKQLDNAKNLIDELSQILSKNHTQLLRTQLIWAKAKLDQSKEV